jgi:hypothetical protein
MQNRKSSWVLSVFIVSVTPFMATKASADGGLNNSTDMVCAVRDVVGCVDGSRCLQGTASSFELPELVILDTKTGSMSGSGVGRDVSFLIFGTCTAL